MEDTQEVKQSFIQKHKMLLIVVVVCGIVLSGWLLYNPQELDRWNNVQGESLTPLKANSYEGLVSGVTIDYIVDTRDVDDIKLNCDGIDIRPNNDGTYYYYGERHQDNIFKSNSDIENCQLTSKDCIIQFCNEAKTVRDTPPISPPIQEDSIKLQEYKILLYETTKPIDTITEVITP